jgi:hypothetical protein
MARDAFAIDAVAWRPDSIWYDNTASKGCETSGVDDESQVKMAESVGARSVKLSAWLNSADKVEEFVTAA